MTFEKVIEMVEEATSYVCLYNDNCLNVPYNPPPVIGFLFSQKAGDFITKLGEGDNYNSLIFEDKKTGKELVIEDSFDPCQLLLIIGENIPDEIKMKYWKDRGLL